MTYPRPIRLALAVVAAAVSTSVALPQNHMESVGFTPNHILVGGGFGEQIDQMNGGLSVFVPIGPTFRVGPRLSYQLNLAYGSHIWAVAYDGYTAHSVLRRDGPFGVGFALHLGRIEKSEYLTGSSTADYAYHAPDGSVHPISPTPLPPDTISVTRDGTFLRVQRVGEPQAIPPTPLAGWVVTFPDATTAYFERDPHVDTGGLWGEAYRVYLIHGPEMYEDASASPPEMVPVHSIEVTYGPTPSGDRSTWGTGTWRCIDRITDSVGREIVFVNTPDAQGGRTEGIRIPIFDAPPLEDPPPTAEWRFTYSDPVTLTPIDSAPVYPGANENRRLLTEVVLPVEPKSTQSPEPDILLQFDYTENSQITDGMLRRRYLPRDQGTSAGDYYEYTYEPHSFQLVEWTVDPYHPGGGYSDESNHTQKHLVEKRLVTGGDTYRWSWERTADAWQHWTNVVACDPDGNCTVYEFFGREPVQSNKHWRTGLPISTKEYAGGALIREERPEYEARNLQPLGYVVLQDTPVATTVWRWELGGGWTLTYRLGFDDYGHATDTIVVGNEPGAYRRIETLWTISGEDAQRAQEHQDQWFLSGWDVRTVYDENGRVFSREKADFDPTGRLLGTRTLWNPQGEETTKDLVASHTYRLDPAHIDQRDLNTGVRESTTVQGGDAPATYTTSYEYQADTYLARVRQGNLDLYAANRDRDVWTGLPRRTLDPNDEFPGQVAPPPGPAGHDDDTSSLPYETTYEWDSLGRLTAVRPPGQATTVIRYPHLHETRVERCTTADGCSKSEYDYDSLGRLVEERRLGADGLTYDTRKTQYDWAGRVTQSSEWFRSGATPVWTLFDYTWPDDPATIDPYGRPWQVTAPDGKITTFTYSAKVRTAEVKVGPDPGVPSKTTWRYDDFGQLVAVDAPLGADASYRYDAAGRLIRAELSDGETVQVRAFAYDALGFLRTATTPEGGTVWIEEYDAAGNAVRTVDARGRVIETTFDAAGRLLEVRDGAGTVLARNTYDTNASGGPTRGKLTKIEAFDDWGVPVSLKLFDYLDPVGRLSALRQKFAAWQGRTDWITDDPEIRIDYAYDEWGTVKRLKYPLLLATADTEDQERRANEIADLEYLRPHGWLATITDLTRGDAYLTVDSYNEAGGALEWRTGNQVATLITPDAMFRPSRIEVTDPDLASLWDSGVYAYDGAGNITAMGSDAFEYDLLSRLTRATIHFDHDHDGSSNQWTEDYEYDAFGNMLSRNQSNDAGGPGFPLDLNVDPRTNRILSVVLDPGTSEAYDLAWDPAGNLVRDPTLFPTDQGSIVVGALRFDGRGRLAGIARQVTGSAEPFRWQEEYGYDEAGLRILRTDESTGLTTFYVRDPGGQVLSEFVRPASSSRPPVWSRDTFYGLGQTLAVAAAESPDPPGALRTTVLEPQSGEDFQVELQWLPPADPETVGSYQVFRRQLPTQPQFEARGAPLSGGATSWSETVTVPVGTITDLLYYVQALNAAGTEGADSRQVRVKLRDGPPPDIDSQDLTATPVDGAIRLSWPRVAGDIPTAFLDFSDFFEYQVTRTVGSVEVDLTPRALREPFFVDPAPPADQGDVVYRVTAADTSGKVGASAAYTYSPTLDGVAPSTPGGVFASSGPGASQASIGWDAPLDPDVDHYDVRRWLEATQAWQIERTVPVGTEWVTLSGLADAQPVTLAVRAVDGTGNASRWSVSVTTQPALSTLVVPELTDFVRWTSAVELRGNGTFLNVYRRPEGSGPARVARRNAQPAQLDDWVDTGLEECKAYLYVATEVDMELRDGFLHVPTGEESAISGSLKVDRNLLAAAPGVDGFAGTTAQFYWNYATDLTTCQLGAGVDYEVVGWQLWRVDAAGTAVDVSGTIDKDAPPPFVYTPPDGAMYEYYVRVVTNNLHEQGSLAQNWLSPFGAPVCATAMGYESEPCDWPTGGGGYYWGGGGGGSSGGGHDESPGDGPPEFMKITDPTVELREEPGENWMPEDLRTPRSEAGWVLAMATPESQREGRASLLPRRLEAGSARIARPRDTSHRPHPSNRGLAGERVAEPGTRRPAMQESPYEVIGLASKAGSPARRGIQLTYLHSDHLGTTRVGTHAVAKGGDYVAFKSASMPFGDLLVDNRDSRNRPKGFAGHQRDENSRLVYMMARSYSPVLGRFVTADLLIAENRYSYVDNNPVVFFDPFGLKQALPKAFIDMTFLSMAAYTNGPAHSEKEGKKAENRKKAYDTLNSEFTHVDPALRDPIETAINFDPEFAKDFAALGDGLDATHQLNIGFADVDKLVKDGVMGRPSVGTPDKASGGAYVSEKNGVKTLYLVVNSNPAAGVEGSVQLAAAIAHEVHHWVHDDRADRWTNYVPSEPEEWAARRAAYRTARKLVGKKGGWKEVPNTYYKEQLRWFKKLYQAWWTK